MRDSGGLFAKYGPLTVDAERPDGQWVRVRFHRHISFRRADRFAAAISKGEPIPPNARVTIDECDPPYKAPDRWADVDWLPISAAPVGELPSGSRETYLVKYGDAVTHGTYRESWLGEWGWFDAKRRRIKPEWFTPRRPSGWRS